MGILRLLLATSTLAATSTRLQGRCNTFSPCSLLLPPATNSIPAACLPPKRGPAPPAATHRDRRGPLPMLTAVLAMLCSIAFFNFFGISVTKHMSAAHRMVLDSLRVMVVWGFGLAVHALV